MKQSQEERLSRAGPAGVGGGGAGRSEGPDQARPFRS